MMRVFLLLFLFMFGGCATKYMLPGNRFITPESQGEAYRGQFEFQKTTGNELSIEYLGTNVEGVTYAEVPRTGFLLSNSIFNQFDLIWSHTAGANSMFGGKFQFLGGSRVSKEVGHKLSIAALIGSNDYKTDDQSIEYTLGGQEFMVLYGYRFLPEILAYTSLSQATYTFDGEIVKGSLKGQRPKIDSNVRSISGGIEASMTPVFAKLELTYQSIDSDRTKSFTHYLTGLSIGLSW